MSRRSLRRIRVTPSNVRWDSPAEPSAPGLPFVAEDFVVVLFLIFKMYLILEEGEGGRETFVRERSLNGGLLHALWPGWNPHAAQARAPTGIELATFRSAARGPTGPVTWGREGGGQGPPGGFWFGFSLPPGLSPAGAVFPDAGLWRRGCRVCRWTVAPSPEGDVHTSRLHPFVLPPLPLPPSGRPATAHPPMVTQVQPRPLAPLPPSP